MSGASLSERLFLETDLYVELQSVLEDERRAIIERDYQGLNDLLARKDALITRIAGLAEQRGRLGVNGKGAEQMGGGQGRDMAEARGALGAAMKTVRTMNTHNRLLIRASLQNVNSTLDLIESFCTAGTYCPTGHVQAKPLKGVSLNKGV